MNAASSQTERPDWLYVLLERVRAGLGAAGVTAAFVEGVSSTRALTGFVGGIATPLVITLSLLAFLVVSYIVDVPRSREQDAEK
jgi:hypothetical protein